MKPVLKALAICAAGGVLFSALRAPLPWMLGPLLAMAFGKFLGADLASPKGGRATGQLIIGCALGLYFTPAVAGEVAAHWYLLIAAAMLAVLLAYASGWVLMRSAGLDATTALFASVPGGAAEMTVLGERHGARSDRVVLAQALRVLIVVLIVPFVFTGIGLHGGDAYRPAQFAVDTLGLVALLATAALVGGVLAKLGTPNAWMLGPLGVTVALTFGEVNLSSIPTWLSNTAQLLIGCSLGSGFERESLRTSPRFIGMVCLSVALAMLGSALCAWGLAVLGSVPVSTMVLAAAPGGMAEMCVTANVLQLGVPLVTAAHVTRVIILVSTTAPMFRLAKHLRRSWRT
ncbi:MAG: AbrB family transcriptional regulator [Betaproteobacteria bacterium]|nr:MAG: AbrB family transcriptional regulator [Betaproteobacteria bacterium]